MSNSTNTLLDEAEQENREQIESNFKTLSHKPFWEDWTEEEKFVIKEKMYLFCRDHNLMDLYYQFHPEEETATEPNEIRKLIVKKKMLRHNLGNEIDALKKKLI